ncbi:NAD(P)H-hydrate dehydratase [Flavobacterium sp. SUN046]|uniref:NAD(P)H-hydrate dehydratase n=1 Tax=Flavobacterium sp. SUN046 TaxID=3002440 RepID=UPI002DBCDA12|nr:NAD(P)H-hydrate dehydratase [Flavobacterium sp. SUN046]MEC4048424.1 NAD(P)H-hydrate dehydratase [Flavobacterium sp. SUN046]
MPSLINVSKDFIRSIYKPINPLTHKGLQGHALIIGGSYGKMGSVALSSRAALKSGCGLVTAFIPQCGYQTLQNALPEVMVLTDEADKYLSNILFDFKPSAIGIGIGMGVNTASELALQKFLKTNTFPLVVDADGINILSKNNAWISLLPKNTILTPHPKELERLIGSWSSDEEKIDLAVLFAKRHNCIMVLKDAKTLITDGDSIFQNTTGNAALATAGSGDVLTGIITGLLAQGYDALHAAILGVYLHGTTADIALPDTGYQSFIASDIINYLGKAYLQLEK